MIRFYANQAGYLPKGRKIAVLAQENRADEMEKMKDKKVSLWNEKGEQTAVKQAVYAGVDESAEDKVWHIDFSDLTEEGTVTFQDGEGAVLGSCIISSKAYHTLNQTLCKALYFQRCGIRKQYLKRRDKRSHPYLGQNSGGYVLYYRICGRTVSVSEDGERVSECDQPGGKASAHGSRRKESGCGYGMCGRRFQFHWNVCRFY